MKLYMAKLHFEIVALLIVLTVGVSFNIANAQDSTLYDSTNGLVTSNINDACQTADGYIWLAQYEGLTRFDGDEFQVINTVKLDGEEENLEQITSVENDLEGGLYIGTKKLGVVYAKNGQYTKLTGKAGMSVNDICVRDNVAYVATTDGAYICNDGKVTWLKDTKWNSVTSITSDGKSVYYTNDDGEVFKSEDGSSQVFYKDEEIKTLRYYSGKLYMGSMYGKLITVTKNNVKTYKIADNNPINTIVEESYELYLGTDNGIYTLGSGKIRKLKDKNTNTTVNSIFFDYEKEMWAAGSNGITCKHFYAIESMFDTYGIKCSSVNACFYYNNLLYVGTDEGLIIIDEDNKKTVSNNLTNKLKNIRIRDFEEYQGKLYIATYSAVDYAVLIYDGSNINTLDPVDMVGDDADDSVQFESSQVRCLSAVGGRLFIGTNYGITVLENGKCKTVQVAPRPLSISVIDGKLYVCTDGDGVHIYDSKLNETDVLKGTEGETILKIIKYNDGLIYGIGTKLYYQDKEGTLPIQFTNYGSIVDLRVVKDCLLVYTNGGVFFLDKENLLSDEATVKLQFSSANGMNSGVTANGRSLYLKDEDSFYFNCQDGVYKYNRSSPIKKSDFVKIAIKSMNVDGTELNMGDSVNLDKDSNRFTVNLSVLSFIDRENTMMYYKMSGVDNKENVANFNRQQNIEYTNLKGGDYKLEIYCVNSSGLKSNEIVLKVHKNLKWHEYKAVQVAIGILLILLVLVIINLRTYNLRRQAELRKKITEDSLEAIAHTIDAKDDYTKGHSVRVARLAICIGKNMNMPDKKLEMLYYIGLMHDIGKVGVPDYILTKPGKLSPEEYDIMKKHPEIGYSILEPIRSIPDLQDGVHFHHERFDGQGYPKGLRGKEIPEIARIISCADSYDAMATNRCYRTKLADEEIIAEFKRCSGTQFDPDIVEIVLECIESGEFREIVNRELDAESEYLIAFNKIQ